MTQIYLMHDINLFYIILRIINFRINIICIKNYFISQPITIEIL